MNTSGGRLLVVFDSFFSGNRSGLILGTNGLCSPLISFASTGRNSTRKAVFSGTRNTFQREPCSPYTNVGFPPPGAKNAGDPTALECMRLELPLCQPMNSIGIVWAGSIKFTEQPAKPVSEPIPSHLFTSPCISRRTSLPSHFSKSMSAANNDSASFTVRNFALPSYTLMVPCSSVEMLTVTLITEILERYQITPSTNRLPRSSNATLGSLCFLLDCGPFITTSPSAD